MLLTVNWARGVIGESEVNIWVSGGLSCRVRGVSGKFSGTGRVLGVIEGSRSRVESREGNRLEGVI